jgi:hypothetical protein
MPRLERREHRLPHPPVRADAVNQQKRVAPSGKPMIEPDRHYGHECIR